MGEGAYILQLGEVVNEGAVLKEVVSEGAVLGGGVVSYGAVLWGGGE